MRGGAYRIVSRFIASVAWNNGSTEMFDLPALSAHDGRAERDGRGGDGREQDTGDTERRGGGTSTL